MRRVFLCLILIMDLIGGNYDSAIGRLHIMQYQEFVSHVQHQARLDSEKEAETAVLATLRTLGERLSTPQLRLLTEHLAPPLCDALLRSNGAEAFTIHHFFRRITERTPVDLSQAVHQARAVITVLHKATPPAAMENICNHLPADFKPLFARRPKRRNS